MSQSFANINNFPLELDLGVRRPESWELPKVAFSNPLKYSIRFLRCPGPQDGLGYRAMRMGTLLALRLSFSHLWMKNQEV